MMFIETRLKGAFILDVDRREDNRGFFARVFCQREFVDHGLKPVIAQANIAFNHKKGTCVGCISSTRQPLRPSSCDARGAPSLTSSWTCVRKTQPTLTTSPWNLRPTTIGHLRARAVRSRLPSSQDRTETSYQVGEFYAPDSESGLLYSDPRLQLVWPLPVAEISPKDAAWKLLDEIEPELKRKMSC